MSATHLSDQLSLIPKSPTCNSFPDFCLGKSPLKTSGQNNIPSLPEGQFDSLVRELDSVKAKIVQAQANLKSFQRLCETKEKKRHLELEGALDEVISYVEECCEIKQSIGELKQIFHQNENQLKNLKDQLQSLDLTEQKISDLTQTIKNLIQENKQNKDIEEAFKKKLKANDSELETLKNFILKTFEERVMLILRGELRELQLKQDNILLKMTNMTLSQENTIKLAQITEKDNIIKQMQEDLEAKKQEYQEMYKKLSQLEKSINVKSGEIKIETDKAGLFKKTVQNFSTPKANAKIQSLNKTTEPKNQQTFRQLKKDFSKEKSPSPRPSSFINKLTSPVNESKDEKIKSKELASSKEILKYQSPSTMNSLAPKESFKKSCSNFQAPQENKLTNSPPKQARASRYSDVHEWSKNNKPAVKKIELTDLKHTINSVDTATSKSTKAKSLSFRDAQHPVSHFLSNDYDNGSLSTLENNEGSKDLSPLDLLKSNDVTKDANIKISTQRNLNLTSIKENIAPTNYKDTSSRFSTKLGNSTEEKIISLSRDNLSSSTTVFDIGKSVAVSQSIDSCFKNAQNLVQSYSVEEGKVEFFEKAIKGSIQSQKSQKDEKKDYFPSENSYSNIGNSNRKATPRKGQLRDITNSYPVIQFSSQKKGNFYQSRQDSLVNFESMKKRPHQNTGSCRKYNNSDLKNPLESETEDLRGSQIESPHIYRISRNLAANLTNDIKKPAFVGFDDY